MSSLVEWISITSSMLGLAVGAHGVGYAVRSIVTYTITPQPAKSFLRRRTIMTTAVRHLQDSNRKTTVLGVITLIVPKGGNLNTFYTVYSNGSEYRKSMFPMP